MAAHASIPHLFIHFSSASALLEKAEETDEGTEKEGRTLSWSGSVKKMFNGDDIDRTMGTRG